MAETQTKRRWAVINSVDVSVDRAYEPPLKIRWGVDRHTTGTQTITMGRTIIPPKARNQRHYHVCDATFYIVRGPIIVWMGEEKEEYLVPEGHFVYVAAGELHGLLNPNDTEAELIFTYGNCPNRDAAKTIYVEDVWQPAEAD